MDYPHKTVEVIGDAMTDDELFDYLLQFVGENKADDGCVYENEDEIWESIEWGKNSGSENLIPWGYGNSIDIFLNE